MTAKPESVTSLSKLAAEIRVRAIGSPRFVVALAGPPGAGKSTVAEELCQALSVAGTAVPLVPMDGFHYDDTVLRSRGHLPRKGAPFTFDVAGYRTLLQRIRSEGDSEIAFPVFDRNLELSRAGAALVPPGNGIIVTEGNYLLLDEAPWTTLTPLFDLTIMIRTTRDALEQRLVSRWLHHGLDEAAARRRAQENDLINAELVLSRSRPSDYLWQN